MMLVLLQLLFRASFFLFQTLVMTVPETSDDLRVKGSAALTAAVSLMNGGIASTMERRCDLGENGWRVTSLQPAPTHQPV